MKEKYIIWNDAMGMVAMGTYVNKNVDGSYMVKNPCSVIFSVSNEIAPGQEDVPEAERKVRGMLNFEIQPYIFNAVLKSEQVWMIRPAAVLDPVEINEELENAYIRTVAMTSNTK